MGFELELSELAVIRPVRTAGSSEGDVKLTRPGPEDGEDAADTGCVTPTAAVSPSPGQSGLAFEAGCVTPTAAASSVPLQGDAVVEDDIDNTGCVTPTAPTSPTPRRGVFAAVVDACFFTPTSAASVLRPSTECPPAPRKPARSPVAASKRKRCDGRPALQQRCFFPVPRDLTKVFVARGPTDGSPPQAAKKVRVHPVG